MFTLKIVKSMAFPLPLFKTAKDDTIFTAVLRRSCLHLRIAGFPLHKPCDGGKYGN